MYNFIKDRSSEYLVTEKEIHEVEEKFEIMFPQKLKDFYLKYSGATLELRKITVNDERYFVEGIYYIKDSTVALETIMQWDRNDGYISDKMIPLAYDQGGERYYWNTEDEKVYFMDGIDLDNPIYICENISEFFKLLEAAEPF